MDLFGKRNLIFCTNNVEYWQEKALVICQRYKVLAVVSLRLTSLRDTIPMSYLYLSNMVIEGFMHNV